MRIFRAVVLLAMAGFLVGCGASKAVRLNREAVKEAYEIQKPIQVKTSEDDSRPEWTHKAVFESDGKIYFSGGFLDGIDYAVTIRCANAEALKNAVSSISQFIRAEFSEYVQGSNSAYGSGIDRYVSDGIATFAENVHIQGMRQGEVYYEEMFSPSVMQSTYNVFVRLEMSKVDYLHAKAEVLRRLRNKFQKAGELQAKRKADKLLEDLKNELKTAT